MFALETTNVLTDKTHVLFQLFKRNASLEGKAYRPVCFKELMKG
jgi:hypothetical protein